MTEDIHVGSKLRVDLVFKDVTSAGVETPIDLGAVASETVKVWKPDGSLLSPAPTLSVDTPASGLAHIEFDTDVLNQAGEWRAQGEADGYKSGVVTWEVKKNPP